MKAQGWAVVRERRWAIIMRNAPGHDYFVAAHTSNRWGTRSDLIKEFVRDWTVNGRFKGMKWRQLRRALDARCVRVTITVEDEQP